MPTIDCETGQILPDNPPVMTLAALKGVVWDQVKAMRDALETGGIDTPAGRVQSDAASTAKINGLVTAALVAQAAGEPFAARFAMADNSIADLDGPATIAMGVAVAARISAIYEHSFTLRAAIEDAPNPLALQAIDLESGWPA